MNVKRIFWIQRILFLFLFTFLAVFFQQKVDKNACSQNTTSILSNCKNVANLSQEPQFQNITFIQGSGRLNTTLKPISEILEEKEEDNNAPSLASKIKFFNTICCFYHQAFTKSFSFFSHKSFSTYARLYSRICCWRI